jgi:hypothetical protein
MDYYKKYIKYKLKYINLIQKGGVDTYVDELNYDTKYLIIGKKFFDTYCKEDSDIEWNEHYNLLETFIIQKGFSINKINIGIEWGQDCFRYIKIQNEANKIQFYCGMEYFYRFDIFKSFKEIYNLTGEQINSKINKIKPINKLDIKFENQYNLNKGGNIIVLPDNINGKKIISLTSEEDFINPNYNNVICLYVYIPEFNISHNYQSKVFHIDEILCLMPNNNSYDVWFYEPECDDKAYEAKLKEVQQKNIRILRQYFTKEQIILFPLKFDNKSNIISPPLFNRLLLKKNNEYFAIFPKQDDLIKKLIEDRLKKIKFNLGNVLYINSEKLHKNNGNLHCAFKTFPEIVTNNDTNLDIVVECQQII